MKKPNNTETFTYYNANPENKHTTDCVARAISTALEQGYKQTVEELIQVWFQTGYEMTDKRCIEKYLESKGWEKQPQPRKSNNRKYTGKEFVGIFKGTCIAKIGGNHIVCIRDGKVLDIWDSTQGCIGNYWIKA